MAAAARRRRPDAKVYVFGSVVEGRYTAASDIDILLVLGEVGRGEAEALKAEILRELGSPAPVELHVASRAEFEGWYRRFLGKTEEVA